MEDVIEGANILSILNVDEVKLHSLYIVDNTKMGEMYKNGEFVLHSKEDYIKRVSTFLAYLDEKIALQRLLGRAPEEKTLFSNWDTSWWKIYDEIMEYMKENNLKQGIKCKFKNF